METTIATHPNLTRELRSLTGHQETIWADARNVNSIVGIGLNEGARLDLGGQSGESARWE